MGSAAELFEVMLNYVFRLRNKKQQRGKRHNLSMLGYQVLNLSLLRTGIFNGRRATRVGERWREGRERGREGGMEGGRKRAREGEREREGREGGSEEGRKGGRKATVTCYPHRVTCHPGQVTQQLRDAGSTVAVYAKSEPVDAGFFRSIHLRCQDDRNCKSNRHSEGNMFEVYALVSLLGKASMDICFRIIQIHPSVDVLAHGSFCKIF